MGDRLRDYGFFNPFMKDVKNYTYLSGSGINDWLFEIAQYNKILQDYNISAVPEYRQSYTDSSGRRITSDWSATNPGPIGSWVSTPSGRSQVIVEPKIRWIISGDTENAQKAAESIWKNVKIPNPGEYYGDNPLGIGVEGKNDNSFYVTPPISTSPRIFPQAGGAGTPATKTASQPWFITEYANEIAQEFFKNQNVKLIRNDPEVVRGVLSENPSISESIGDAVNNQAAYFRSRDDGGGALGVIARGLRGAAQFASLASGLNALVTGLGSLASGAGLKGAFGAAMNAAKGMPDIGSVVGGAAGSPAIGNLANIGVGGITGAEKGGLTGGLLGAGGAAVGAGIDQAGGVREFVKNPLGNIAGAVGLGGLGGFTPAQIAAMEQASKVGLGSVAQYTPPSSIGQNVISTDYLGGIPNEVIEVVADAGDVTQLGGGFGSSSGGAIGSALGGMLSGAGGAIGAPTLGGLSGIPSIRGTPGNLTGSLQTTASGMTPTAGTGTGGTGITTGTGGLTSGMPGPYSDAYGQGATQSDIENQGMFGMFPELSFGLGSSFGSAGMVGSGAGTAGIGGQSTGLLSTGLGVGGAGTGGDGLGGDGLGGDGLGGDGLGGSLGGSFPWGLLTGGQTGSIGDPASFVRPRPVGVKKKGPGSFYGKLQEPKRRKGIRLRRA